MVAEAANTNDNKKVVQLLLEAGADPKASQINPILVAIKAKNYKVMRVLYEHGVDPNLFSEQ
jgi:ankyrin repeat protein